jgi:hypothetical protein
MDFIQIGIGFIIGTAIFFTGLELHDRYEARKRQKLLDAHPPRFINTACFAQMLNNCRDEQQAKYLIERYKDR